MSEENEKIEINDSEFSREDSVFTALVTISVKTLYFLLISLTVLATCISQIFPFAAAKFYYGLEDYATAVRYTKKYAERGGKDVTEALLYGIEMSEILLYTADSAANAGTKKGIKDINSAAEYLLYFTDSFANNNDFVSRCQAFDKYYADSVTSLAAAIGLYSYKDYTYRMNTTARSILGKTDKLLYSVTLPDSDTVGIYATSQDGYITVAELNILFTEIVDGKSASTTVDGLNSLAIIFNQLSENIVWGSGNLIYDYNLDKTTDLYAFMVETICNVPDISDYSYVNECLKLPLSIQKLYLLDAASNLCDKIIGLFEYLKLKAEEESKPIDEIEKLISEIVYAEEKFSLEYNGEMILLSDYYDNLLRSGIN